MLVDEESFPDDVTIAVLTQARPELIERTFESVEGVRRAIVHLYNSTSVAQRQIVFRLDKAGVTELAVRGTEMCKRLAAMTSTEIVFEYSPESFHHTELDFALEICEAVAAEWNPAPSEKMIINLPTTVEHFPPNVYADRIEWFGRHFPRRSRLSSRCTRITTAEPRCNGGTRSYGRRRTRRRDVVRNGERTGNVDLITLALNLLTQGVDPQLDLSQLDDVKRDCRRMQ